MYYCNGTVNLKTLTPKWNNNNMAITVIVGIDMKVTMLRATPKRLWLFLVIRTNDNTGRPWKWQVRSLGHKLVQFSLKPVAAVDWELIGFFGDI